MKKAHSNRARAAGVHDHKVSDSDLADFLNRLSSVYASPVTGNPALSVALKKLSSKIRPVDPNAKANKLKKEKSTVTASGEHSFPLHELNVEEIKRFIGDSTKTKSQLLALAAERFSIPTSQLQRQKIDQVRAVLMSALVHESSIEILASEASREGAGRTS